MSTCSEPWGPASARGEGEGNRGNSSMTAREMSANFVKKFFIIEFTPLFCENNIGNQMFLHYNNNIWEGKRQYLKNINVSFRDGCAGMWYSAS